jgi:hypothetical protein
VFATDRIKDMIISSCENGTWPEAGNVLAPALAGYMVRRSPEFISMLSTSGTGKVVRVALRPERHSR